MKCEKCGNKWPVARVETYGSPSGPFAACDDCLFAEVEDLTPTADAAAKYVATYRPY